MKKGGAFGVIFPPKSPEKHCYVGGAPTEATSPGQTSFYSQRVYSRDRRGTMVGLCNVTYTIVWISHCGLKSLNVSVLSCCLKVSHMLIVTPRPKPWQKVLIV